MEDKINRVLVPRTCPVCGETFYPAPMHSYKIGRPSDNKLVCTYSCMRKYEKEHGDLGFSYAFRGRRPKRRNKTTYR